MTNVTVAQEKALKMAESKGGGINHVTKAYGEKHGIAYAPIQTIFALVEKGLLVWESYGHWVITDAGRAAIATPAASEDEIPECVVTPFAEDICYGCGCVASECDCEPATDAGEGEARALASLSNPDEFIYPEDIDGDNVNWEWVHDAHNDALAADAENAALYGEPQSMTPEDIEGWSHALYKEQKESERLQDELTALRAERDALRAALLEAQEVIRKAMIAAEKISEPLADEIAARSFAFRLDFIHNLPDNE